MTFCEEQDDFINSKLLNPVFDQFDKEDWSNVNWSKFVIMVLVCNGGTNHMLNVNEIEETVQNRLMRLVTDHQVLSNPSNAEKLIDF